MNRTLSERMKHQYEQITQTRLPRRTYTIIRLDGKNFHSYTKGLRRPYDETLMLALDVAAFTVLNCAQGAKFAYTQSDEVSILLTDFEKTTTEAWFDGNVQKIVSVSASLMTAAFNKAMSKISKGDLAAFDARVFTIPDYVEVENYFIDRQKDAMRNSVQMLAQYYASPARLNGLNNQQQRDLIKRNGGDWLKHPVRFQRGAYIDMRGRCEDTPVFTKNRKFLTDQIPKIWAEDL